MKNTRHKLGRAMTFALMAITVVTVARTQTNKQVNQAQLRSLQQEDYAKRELSAPPAARQKLAELRQRIKAHNLGFEVGYTAPMERGARSITGGGLPPNIVAIAKKQNIIARQVTQLDRQTRDQALKTIRSSSRGSRKCPRLVLRTSRALIGGAPAKSRGFERKAAVIAGPMAQWQSSNQVISFATT